MEERGRARSLMGQGTLSLCFVRGVNLGLRLGFGLALCRFNLSHLPGRQGAPLLTRFGSLRISSLNLDGDVRESAVARQFRSIIGRAASFLWTHRHDGSQMARSKAPQMQIGEPTAIA